MEILTNSDVFLGIILILSVIVTILSIIALVLILPAIVNFLAITKHIRSITARISEEGVDVIDDLTLVRKEVASFLRSETPHLLKDLFIQAVAFFMNQRTESGETKNKKRKTTRKNSSV